MTSSRSACCVAPPFSESETIIRDVVEIVLLKQSDHYLLLELQQGALGRRGRHHAAETACESGYLVLMLHGCF